MLVDGSASDAESGCGVHDGVGVDGGCEPTEDAEDGLCCSPLC